MNRSILIVICDFLLLSLLTFSTDINRMADENTQPPSKVVIASNTPVNSGADLAAAMKLALTEEHKNAEQLRQQMSEISAGRTQQQTQLTQLQQQLAAAQTNQEALNQRLQASATQAQLTQQQLAEQQAAAQKASDLAAALRRQLDDLSKSNQMTQTEKQQLATKLQLAEVEARSANEKAALLQQEAQTAHAENVRFAEGFKSLATNSSQLTQEIRANTPLAPNTIFSDFVSNRVEAGFAATRTVMFSMDTTKNKIARSVLATDGTNIFALCHVEDTPLALFNPGTDWDKLSGTITRGGTQVPVRSLAFHAQDPRVVMLPVSAEDAQKLGGKIYRLSSDPYKFQDAVLVGANESYYGECNFKIELSTPQYVKLDRSLLKGLFGKFNPSRGDLVFSHAGELLGVMVNNTYCLTLHSFAAAATLPFDRDLHGQHTGGQLARLYDEVFQMPLRLQ
jgi:hypothetical protein